MIRSPRTPRVAERLPSADPLRTNRSVSVRYSRMQSPRLPRPEEICKFFSSSARPAQNPRLLFRPTIGQNERIDCGEFVIRHSSFGNSSFHPLIHQGSLMADVKIRMPKRAAGGRRAVRAHRSRGQAFLIPADKPAIALCRCGHSARRPFCDGAHKSCGFDSDERRRCRRWDSIDVSLLAMKEFSPAAKILPGPDTVGDGAMSLFGRIFGGKQCETPSLPTIPGPSHQTL